MISKLDFIDLYTKPLYGIINRTPLPIFGYGLVNNPVRAIDADKLYDLLLSISSWIPLPADAGDTTKFLNAAGTYTVPAGGGGGGDSWLLLTGGDLTGANVITGSIVNTLTYRFNSLGAVRTYGAGALYQNTTLAAAGAGNQQWSPSVTWEGQGWKTTATAGSQSVAFSAYAAPIQGTTAPTANWILDSSINGGAAVTLISAKSTGIVTIGTQAFPDTAGLAVSGGLVINGNNQVGNGSTLSNLYINPGFPTNLPAGSPFEGTLLGIGPSFLQWATGALGTQKWVSIQTPNISFVGASTLTHAYTMWIDQPQAGTNATITNNYALGLGGNMRIDGSIMMRNASLGFRYIITTSSIAADRTLTLPLLTGNDTFVTAAFAQTLTNKTIGDKLNGTVAANTGFLTVTLVAGTKVTANTSVTASSLILYSVQTPGGTVGTITVTKSAGVSFTLTSSSGADTSTLAVIIIN